MYAEYEGEPEEVLAQVLEDLLNEYKARRLSDWDALKLLRNDIILIARTIGIELS